MRWTEVKYYLKSVTFYINLVMKAFVKKSAKRIKSGRILLEKFYVFINEWEWEEKQSSTCKYTKQQQHQQTQQENELTKCKTSIVCSKVPPSKIYTTQNWTCVANQLTGF